MVGRSSLAVSATPHRLPKITKAGCRKIGTHLVLTKLITRAALYSQGTKRERRQIVAFAVARLHRLNKVICSLQEHQLLGKCLPCPPPLCFTGRTGKARQHLSRALAWGAIGSPKIASRGTCAPVKRNRMASQQQRQQGEEQTKAARAARFARDGGRGSSASETLVSLRSRQGARGASSPQVFGCCTAVEKGYTRLTSMPTVDSVRPPHVLRAALQRVLDSWQKDHDYSLACDQLKSIRQDMTVQHLRDHFCAHVYETHARIALESGDFPEFKGCHAMASQLHEEGLSKHVSEFQAYGVLFALLTNMELSQQLQKLPEQALSEPELVHALAVCRAVIGGRYSSLGALRRTAPHHGKYFIDAIIRATRHRVYHVLLRSYMPSLPLTFLSHQLYLQDNTQLRAFLTERHAVVDEKTGVLDIKASRTAAAAAAAVDAPTSHH